MDDGFSKTFCRAHNVGRTDSFVCGDKNHFLDTVFVSELSNVICADDIRSNCLSRRIFHERDMFIRCSVVHVIRTIFLHDGFNAEFVICGADKDNKVDILDAFGSHLTNELLLNVINTVLVDIEKNEGLWMGLEDLTDKLRTDCATGTGDEDVLAIKHPFDFGCLKLNWVSAKELSEIDVGDLPVIWTAHLIEKRHSLDADWLIGKVSKDLVISFFVDTGHADDDFFNLVFGDVFGDIGDWSFDWDLSKGLSNLVRVIVKDA